MVDFKIGDEKFVIVIVDDGIRSNIIVFDLGKLKFVFKKNGIIIVGMGCSEL